MRAGKIGKKDEIIDGITLPATGAIEFRAARVEKNSQFNLAQAAIKSKT